MHSHYFNVWITNREHIMNLESDNLFKWHKCSRTWKDEVGSESYRSTPPDQVETAEKGTKLTLRDDELSSDACCSRKSRLLPTSERELIQFYVPSKDCTFDNVPVAFDCAAVSAWILRSTLETAN